MKYSLSYACLAILMSVLSFSAEAQISVDADFRDPRQKAVIDEVNYRFTYRTKFSEDTVGHEKYYDNQVLEIGVKYVRYYSRFAEVMDSTWYKHSVTGERKSAGGSYKRTEDLQPGETGQYEDLFSTTRKREHLPSSMPSEKRPTLTLSRYRLLTGR